MTLQKRILPAWLLIVLSTIPQASAQNLISDEFIRARFDPFGSYTILGRTPQGFADFYNFQIDLIDKPTKGRPLRINGFVQSGPNGEIICYFDTVTITLEKLAFRTKEEQGVSYSLEGRFLRKGDFSRLPRKTAALEGRLVKYQGAKKVAEAKLKFWYYEPH
jgi:hypothetical protein